MNAQILIHSALLFHQCGVMPIHNGVKFPIVISVYKSLNGLAPDYMKDMFERVADVSVRSTRLSATNNLLNTNRKFCVSRNALRYWGANLYNSLDTITQSSQTLASFKY